MARLAVIHTVYVLPGVILTVANEHQLQVE